MARLINSGGGPFGALTPQRIAHEGLFQLDVDDSIWQDVGLEDDSYINSTPAQWLADENVRKGIAAMLELDRCQEEEQQLGQECCALQEWMMEEWSCVDDSKKAACKHTLTFIISLY